MLARGRLLACRLLICGDVLYRMEICRLGFVGRHAGFVAFKIAFAFYHVLLFLVTRSFFRPFRVFLLPPSRHEQRLSLSISPGYHIILVCYVLVIL